LLADSSAEPLGHAPACVHELLAARAASAPDAPALSCGGEVLTRGELERRANRLAHHLRRRGVGPETRVGLCLERGPEMVVGVLGVLKAGGAYVPLDPAYPAERLAYTLADSGAALLVSQGGLVDALPPFEGEVVRLDAEREAIAAEPEEAPESGVGVRNAAYVIYTSGSTGRPKGVVVEHAGLAATLLGARDTFGFGAGEVMPVLASYAFDIWGFETFAPLLAGGQVRLLGRETVRDAEALVEELASVEALHAVPALMREVVARVQAGPGTLERMRRVFVGGDAVAPDLLEQMQAAFPEAQVWVLYGPTEGSILSSAAALRRERSPDWQVVGRPLPGVGMYVLDAGGSLLPPGVPGELCLAGGGVARGYLGRADATAEKFVPDPFGGVPGARLYRTGDRVRRRPDGEYEFLGRTDAQVKIRGFRIEPGEIEAALLALSGVHEAVVAVREDAPGQKRLAAYVVPREGADLSTAELRARLAERLPEHMVPSAFVVLDKLPLNANGKVDRRALPAPEQGAGAEYAAPRTPAEELLAGIWAEVLKSERVGALDNFFELGGHSLLATQVISRVRAAFGVEAPLKALFEAPTVAGLAGRIEALRSAGTLPAPPIVPVVREGPLPLSFAQQRLWVVDRIEPDSAAYNMPFPLRLRGAPELPVLRASLDALVRRHETLRTTFSEEGGRPVQVVHPPRPVPLPTVDLRGLPEKARRAEAKRLSGAEAMRPFDLARGPLLRSTLLRLGETDHALLFTLHHIVSDGWSMQVLVREVSALYAAFARGESADLPELPVQYADFAVWQRAWLSGDVLEAQIGFWKERLGGAPPLLTVSTDRPRSAAGGARGRTHRFILSPGLSSGLRALSRAEGATLFMTLLAGWQALLGRYAAQEDVVVGTPIAGRTRQETEGLIGFFVNMLALRADLSGDPTWGELLGRARETALGAYDHQELPFERLVDELGVERSLTHTPVFQAIFALQRSGRDDDGLELGGLALERWGQAAGVTKFDLNLTVTDEGEGLGGLLAYRAGLFEAETVARMAAHLEVLLEAMASRSGQRLSEVPLLRGAERAQLLYAWNGPDTDYTGELCIHELVHAQLLRTPGAPALRFEGRSLTYAELYARAAQLANRLRREGVGPEARVGICMEPALEMAVSVLGVLLAGGAYLPLDPELPAERRAYVLGDAAPVLLLTQAALVERLEGCGVPLLAVDAEAGSLARECEEAPETGVGPDNLAYVIYTSGSTGRPKGVLVEHRGVGNTFLELGRVYGAAPGERNLAYAPLHFDASVADLFVALCNGAELVLARREAMLPGEDLLRTLREERITHLKTMPSALAVTPVEALPELRVIVTGGETLPVEQVRRWGGGRRFFNGYGATEAGIRMTSSAYTADGGDPPIGRAVANTQLYVLDAWGEPVPMGVAGELYIGGVGVARGYLGRPELTAERFVPDPHRGVAGARLYRTGDVGRRRADGEVEFLGRSDFQVKVRGYRVELGEIEAVLRGHPQVRDAVVLLREDAPGQQRLAAYVVPEVGAELAAGRLRAHAAEQLPEYMVPGAYVVLEQLPTTANGKIDRRALPAPERTADEAHAAPRSLGEELLAGIWAEVLGMETVGVEENFFGLGGHSLLATQVISRVRAAFGVEVPLKALFEAPTVAGLAGRIEALRGDGALLAPPILPVPRDGSPLPLSFAQQRLWLVDRIEPGSAAYNMPSPLRLRGALELPVLRASLDALVRRHESLRTVFPEEGGRPAQVVRPAGRVPLPMVDLRGLPDPARQAEARRLSGAEAMRPFDLARGPLLRGTLVRLDEEEHVLLFNLHHVVSDGWSRGVLVREVSALYGAFSRGEEPRLPALPVQYADFAVWQREWLSGEVLEAQIGFWRERLEGAPPLLEIPTDRPRRAGQSPLAARHPFALSPELSSGLRALSRREGATLFMTLLAGWQALLSRYSGQDDVVVGTPIAGRNRRETEG
ncbi:MAG: amino acid adenylation domain-containing protein, partial [Gemmatimonadota bacterium]